jgi:cytochrome P450
MTSLPGNLPPTTMATTTERHGTGPDDGGRVTLDELHVNPYPVYRQLRDAGVPFVEALGRWMIARWDDVEIVEKARTDFSANETSSNLTRVIGHQMLRADGEAHKRLRSAAQDPLRGPAVQERGAAMQRIADELIDDFIDLGRADLVEAFAAPFAARCLAEILGLDDATPQDIHFWSQSIMNGSSNYDDDPEVWLTARGATDAIDTAVEAALGGSGPRAGSIIHAMASSQGAGRPLSFDEVSSNVKVMIGGGFNEPRDAIGTAVLGLLSHRTQHDAVIADATLWPKVVEESVRWVAPIGCAPREAVRPIRIGTTELQPGARVLVNFASANRDEREWDRPDEFDITREKKRNLAFGVGHHFCLGVWMARHQVGAVALPTLLRRLSGLRLDLDDPPRVRGWVFRGPLDMTVRWDGC